MAGGCHVVVRGYDSIDDEMETLYPDVKDPEAKRALRLKMIDGHVAALLVEQRERAESNKRKAGSTEPPAKRRKKKKGKPEPVEFYARAGVPALGTVVNGPAGYGEWRTVPGFSAAKLRVSKTGFYQVVQQGRWLNPSAGCEVRKTDGTMRHSANVDENGYFVYHFVLRAFKGAQPHGMTADHRDQNTSNNNSYNLEWKTPTEQTKNRRTDKKPHSNGKPVRIRHKDWPIERGWEDFENGGLAAKKYGLDKGNVSATANGNRTHTGCFYVEFLPAKESQQPLAIGDDSNLAAPPLAPPPADKLGAGPSTTIEEWKLAPGVTNLRVSTRGRVQTKEPRGNGWSYMYTPVAVAGAVYPSVVYKKKHIVVHRLVWMTFVGGHSLRYYHRPHDCEPQVRQPALGAPSGDDEHAEPQQRPQTDFRA
tara:strand:- start:1579 stop:2841 length:1263 start_codon:yes stop_codon:yes gene_type:complete